MHSLYYRSGILWKNHALEAFKTELSFADLLIK